jgi:transposase-like protein
MRLSSNRRRAISAARRGQIVQRVLVEGWTIDRAAAAFDTPPRLVEIWVAAYRRHGMASLRRPPRRTVAAERLELWLLRPTLTIWRRIAGASRRFFAPRRRAAPASMHAFKDDRRGGGSS